MRALPHSLQKGFTLIEIMVIAPIVILAIGAFVTVIISMTGEVLASRGSNALAYNIQDALNRIDQDVRQSTGFIAQNNITLTAGEAQGYNNDATNFTNVGGASGTSLILNMLVTNGNPISQTSGVVYLKNQPNACASDQVQDNVPMSMNVVYFVKNNTLWRRTIMPSNYASASVACATPWQQPSCAPGYTAAFCKTNDIKLVEGVSAGSLFIQYYTSANAATPNTTSVDTGSSVTVRNAALASTTTASVSIVGSQSVAGRTIERSGTLRTTRLETNASVIAPTVATTTPTAPIVTGKLVNGEAATFTWPIASGNNVVYDADYNINGGGWNNVQTGSSTRSYTRIATRGQTVNFRVRSTNTAGTSSYTTSSVQVPLWNSVALQNNWTNYDPVNFSTFGFTKTDAGLVMLKGLIRRTGTPVSSEIIATLPEGFRPPTRLMFQVISNSAFGRLFVEMNGDITVIGVSGAWVSMQDLSFISSNAGYTPTTLSTVAPWVTYGSPYDPPSSVTDSTGRVNVIGLLKNGSTSSEVNMVAFASGTTPNKRVYIPTPSATGTYSIIVADTSGYMKTGITSATYTGINSKFYPGSRGDGTDCENTWCSLTVGASWVPYGAVGSVYAQPQYTKGSDGVVMLRGLIKNGTVSGGTTLATLPVGYRPKEHYIFQVNAGAGLGRIDVFPTGIVQIQLASSAYTALDNIYFLTD